MTEIRGTSVIPAALAEGELHVAGRLVEASNATLLCTASLDGSEVSCVYKPVAGERPLWDFPDGTLAGRERAAYLVSEAAGLHLVPPTILRDGPFGPGMCQLWVDADEDDEAAPVSIRPGTDAPDGWCLVLQAELSDGSPAVLAHLDDERLRRVALFDAVVNNADRKGGHLLPVGERIYAIDHGVTFAVAPKLRTVLWGWRGEPFTPPERATLTRIRDALTAGPLVAELADLLTPDEVEAARTRAAALLDADRFPFPSGEWRVLPWPLL